MKKGREKVSRLKKRAIVNTGEIRYPFVCANEQGGGRKMLRMTQMQHIKELVHPELLGQENKN